MKERTEMDMAREMMSVGLTPMTYGAVYSNREAAWVPVTFVRYDLKEQVENERRA